MHYRRRLALALPVALALTTLPVLAPPSTGRALYRTLALKTLGRVRAPISFRLLGLAWRRGAPPAGVRVRTSLDGRHWSRWSALEVQTADAEPDPDRAEPAASSSDPLWVGRARYVEVRGHLGPGTRLVFVDPGPDPPRPRAAAEASPSMPTIITRAEWGADESIRKCCPQYAEPLQMVFVHHTVTGNDYRPSDSPAIVRSIYEYHVKTNGWSDIGYNFLVDQYGQIFEGRYGGMTRAVIGAHTLGFNAHSAGVAVIGTFDSVAPSAAAFAALDKLLAWRMDVAYIDPLATTVMTSAGNPRYPEGTQVRLNTISGHRDVYDTDCPGDAFYAQLGAIRRQVAPMGDPKIYDALPPSSVITPNGDGYDDALALAPHFSSSVSWSASITGRSNKVWASASGSGTSFTFGWSGRDSQGALAPEDTYTLSITAHNARGSIRPVSVPIFVARFPSIDELLASHLRGSQANRWRWLLRDANAPGSPGTVFDYGNPSLGDFPVVGDWNGDGRDTIGIVRPDDKGRLVWYLRNTNGPGPPDIQPFAYGNVNLGDFPVVGDWNGDGRDTIGVARPSGGAIQWLLRNDNGPGNPDVDPFTYGSTDSSFPVVGDWNARQTSASYASIDLKTGRWTWNLRNGNGNSSLPLIPFAYGNVLVGDFPLAGDWNGDGTATVGVARPDSAGHVAWLLRNQDLAGSPDVTFSYGTWRSDVPVVGDWDGKGADTVGVVRPARS